jgi:hypothetical protein
VRDQGRGTRRDRRVCVCVCICICMCPRPCLHLRLHVSVFASVSAFSSVSVCVRVCILICVCLCPRLRLRCLRHLHLHPRCLHHPHLHHPCLHPHHPHLHPRCRVIVRDVAWLAIACSGCGQNMSTKERKEMGGRTCTLVHPHVPISSPPLICLWHQSSFLVGCVSVAASWIGREAGRRGGVGGG